MKLLARRQDRPRGMSRRSPRRLATGVGLALVVASLLAATAAPPAVAARGQDDGGTRDDAGDAMADATRLDPAGPYLGFLAGGADDPEDWYKFHVEQGSEINIALAAGILTGYVYSGEEDNLRRLSFQLLDPNGLLLDTPNTNQGDARVTLLYAPVTGDYHLRITSEYGFTGDYGLCFVPPQCPDFGVLPQSLIFGGSLRHEETRVLLVPPMHGDLGNPDGPTQQDYLDATLRGIRAWEPIMDRFASDYPAYAYLREIDVEVVVYDDANPVDPAGFDVILGYVPYSGPVFRGVASGGVSLQPFFDVWGLGDAAHFSGRLIALSLLANSPRAGQLEPDYPEVNDLYTVTLHEFAHTFGLGHTATWTKKHGADLMNSPATFVFGDGDALGDGGERTPAGCISSLNLYGMALLYRWIPSGAWEPSEGTYLLPKGMPYKLYCE